MKKKQIGKSVFALLLFLGSWQLQGQIGGKYTYEFLASPASSRITGVGGSMIAVIDDDVALAAANPALLTDSMTSQFSVSHSFSFAGVSNGHIAYARSLKKLGITTHFAATYVSFGEFTRADEFGNNLGTFTGSETAITIGAGKQLNERLRFGVNLKGIFGSLDNFGSVGIATDLGLTYEKLESNFILAFVVKNLGTELSSYGNTRGRTPLDIQIGISKKLKHLPFRFYLTAHQLQQWNISYDDPDFREEELFGEEASQPGSLENMFRHLIFGGEFLLGKSQSFRLRFGYNHLRRQELTVSSFRSLAGFSLGVGFRAKGFRFDYGVGYHHLAGAANHLTISTNLNRFSRIF